MINTPHRNIALYNHPLIGSEPRIYRPDLPKHDPDAPENKPGHPDFEPGTLVVGNGMPVGIKAVFQNWNGVPGLDMLYVYCFATGKHTHVTPFDLGLNPLDPDTGQTTPFGDALVVRRYRVDGMADYYIGPLAPAKRLFADEYGAEVDAYEETTLRFHMGQLFREDVQWEDDAHFRTTIERTALAIAAGK